MLEGIKSICIKASIDFIEIEEFSYVLSQEKER